MKLFNFSLGGNATTPNIKGGKCYFVNLCVYYVCVKQNVCVCVCVCFYLLKKKTWNNVLKKKKLNKTNYVLNNEF